MAGEKFFVYEDGAGGLHYVDEDGTSLCIGAVSPGNRLAGAGVGDIANIHRWFDSARAEADFGSITRFQRCSPHAGIEEYNPIDDRYDTEIPLDRIRRILVVRRPA